MLRTPYQPENVIGDFQKNNEYYTGGDIEYLHGKLSSTGPSDAKLFARMVVRDGRHYFDIKQSDGQWHSYPVDYTIGSKWQQAYATKLPNGQIHVFPIQYNVREGKWINYWKSLDGPGTERSDPYNFERLDDSTSYQAKCAVCHTSQLRTIPGAGLGEDSFEFREPGIGCEMCHGPSALHIASITNGTTYDKRPLDPPVDFRKISNRDFVAICAQCHMQSALRDFGSHGELNYFPFAPEPFSARIRASPSANSPARVFTRTDDSANRPLSSKRWSAPNVFAGERSAAALATTHTVTTFRPT